ncbi:MAG: hypothetical protein QG635_1317, partial [Bacteroidota bacterium]|nr:hypothetical protein [Bacteroidota bacterium]
MLDTETDPSVLFQSSNFNMHGLAISEDSQERDSYKAVENLVAGYAMADVPLILFGNRIRVIGGVRIESSTQKLDSYYPIAFNSVDSTFMDSNFVDKSFVDFLPALNFIYEINKEMNLRISASQTLTRPSLREYAPFTFYDFLTQMNIKGNPKLQRALIQNYDIRWEAFPNPGEVISVSGFYKIFENAIEETITPASSEDFGSFDNAQGRAYNYGIELEVRKNLGFISDVLGNFLINSNLALIYSEITVSQTNKIDNRTMCGQSPYSFNLGLYYYKSEWGT